MPAELDRQYKKQPYCTEYARTGASHCRDCKGAISEVREFSDTLKARPQGEIKWQLGFNCPENARNLNLVWDIPNCFLFLNYLVVNLITFLNYKISLTVGLGRASNGHSIPVAQARGNAGVLVSPGHSCNFTVSKLLAMNGESRSETHF